MQVSDAIDIRHDTRHGERSDLRVPLRLSALRAIRSARRRAPVTFGVPFAPGCLFANDTLQLEQDGRPGAVQSRPLDMWPDGSVRWLLVHARVDHPVTRLELTRAGDEGPGRAPATASVAIRRTPAHVCVQTGAIDAEFSAGRPFPITSIRDAQGRELLGARGISLVVRDAESPWTVKWSAPSVELDGRVTSRIVTTGVAHSGTARLDLTFEATLHAALPIVDVRCTIRNPAAAAHPGGMWDLGEAASVLLREVSIEVPFASPADSIRIRPEQERGWVDATGGATIVQASSGGDAWNGPNHVTRDRRVAVDFRGYEIRSGGSTVRGDRAVPVVEVATALAPYSVAARYFWQVFPKAIAATVDCLRVSMFPAECREPQELQPGEQTTWAFTVSFGEDPVSADPLEWMTAPVAVHPSPDYVASTGAVPYLAPDTLDRDGYRTLVRQAIEGPSAFDAKREIIDEYGWRHFGDIYGDHEAVFHKGPQPLVSHYNNQYDAIFGAICQLLRSGDGRWLTLATELASHVVDIDIYHATGDKSAYNGGMFWHTCHYVDADTATHRTYPSRGKVSGGGPSCGHLYTTGLVHAYFLTGDRQYRDAAIGLADYVISCDDGARTVMRWLDTGATGHATVSGLIPYHGPGRAPANSLNALIDGHRLTGDERYLRKAFQILHRCVHPADDIERQDLLDAENKWFYTMFLQSLAKLLDHLGERGRFDVEYFYARESLLAYARWMAAHETPFLDRSAQLEYPTETWAAQDIRKAEILFAAARHADGEERVRFLERAQFFFDYSTRALAGFETRGLCRPVVLLMANGWSQAWHEEHAGQLPAPMPKPHDLQFAPRQPFVPQKERAVAKAKRIVLVGGLTAVAAVGWAVLAFLR